MEDFIETPKEQAIAVQEPAVKKQIDTMWNNEKLLKTAYQAAKYLSIGDIVPAPYKNKPENCIIAIDIANNTGLSPLTVMQNLFIVQGRPAWSGQTCIGLVNRSGRFSKPLEFVFVGEEGDDSFGCYAQTTNLEGKLVVGTPVTIKMAKDEGWYGKSGSKWKTMPIQMLQYRAGAFFARVHCPDVLLGLPMVEEVKDTYGYEEQEKQKVTISFTEGTTVE